MIATIRFEYAGQMSTAILSDEGDWSCPDAEVEATLNTLALTADRSPAAGWKFSRHAQEMAAVLHGTVQFGPVPPFVPNRIY